MLGTSHALLLGAGAAGQVVPQIVSHWKLDETSPGNAVDAGGKSDGQYTSPELGLDPLLADGGNSVGFDGTSTDVEIPHVADFALAAYSIVCYVQFDSGPTVGSNEVFLSKDVAGEPGGLSLEINNDGGVLKLRGYTRDAGGAAIWIGSETGVETLLLNQAYRVVLAVGSNGARLFLDDREVATSANRQGLQSNDEPLVIGSFRGAVGWIHGVIDDVRLYDGALDLIGVNALPTAASIDHQPPQLAYTVPVAPSAPAGGAIYVATAGNDNTGNGTLGAPYKTLAKALSVVDPGGEIVLRKGIYRGEASLTVADANVTIKGYRPDIEADPLDSSNWPIIDGCFDPTGITWELVHSGRQEYRTVQTNLGSGIAHGMIVAGLSTYEMPRWEPLGGLKNPTPMFRLWPYNGTTGPRSLAAFRHTGPVAFGDHNGYCGPGTYRMDDNRIHIRLQPIDPSVNGGEPIDMIPDKHPALNQVFLWQGGNVLFSSIADGLRLEGVFVRGYHRLYIGEGRSTFQLQRSAFWCGEYINYYIFFNSAAGLTVQHSMLDGGHADWFAFRLIKSISQNGGLNWGRITPFNFNGSGKNVFNLIDSIVMNVSDLVVATNSSTAATSVMKVLHNAIISVQDIDQVTHSWHDREIAYNWIRGPLAGSQDTGTSMPAGTSAKYHHNLAIWNHMQINEPGQRIGWPITVGHGSESGWRSKTYYNTIVYANPQENQIQASIMSRPPRGYNQSGEPHESFNNIYILYNRHPPGGDPTSVRYLYRQFATDDPNRKWISDGNGFYVVKDPTVGPDGLFIDVKSTSGSTDADFTSLAAFREHPYYAASIGKYGYSDGMETNSIQEDPDFKGPEAEKQDCRGRPSSDYIPQAANYKTEAVDLSPTGLNRGWPGTSVYQAWRGALDPDGDGSEIGPRTAV